MVSAVSMEIPYRDTTPHSASMSMAGGRRMADTDRYGQFVLEGDVYTQSRHTIWTQYMYNSPGYKNSILQVTTQRTNLAC